MGTIFGILLVLFSSNSFAKVVCKGEDQNSWVKAQRSLNENDELFKYSIDQFGPLIKCNGKVTTEVDGNKFGKMTYYFKKSATMTFESMPPETSVVKIETQASFPDEKDAINQLKKIVAKVGLKVDYSKRPEFKKSNLVETKTFWDPDSGVNGRAFLMYKSDKLVGMGYGMAL